MCLQAKRCSHPPRLSKHPWPDAARTPRAISGWSACMYKQRALARALRAGKKVAGFAPSCENKCLKAQLGEPVCKVLGWELLAETPAPTPPGSVGGRRMYARPNSLLWAAFSCKDPGLSYSKALGTPSTDFFCKLCCVQNALQ